ncbi:MAG TPA: alpha-hydroxy acid oxidase [Nocardioidaceae bacterium]
MGRWLEQLEELAREAMPEETHRHIRWGAGDGVTAAEATAAWERHRFLPRVLRDVTEVDCSTELLGTPVRSPFGIAPTTMQGAAHPDGELGMARAAASGDTLLVVSSEAATTFKEIAATGVAWWLQMYVPADRLVCKPVLDRALQAGARAVVLTADSPGSEGVYGDVAVTGPADPRPRPNLPEGYGTLPGHENAADLGPQDIDWLRKATGLPVVVKGLLRPADARRCVEAGAAAVWVSNHGGRRLDRVAATADCLAAVVDTVGDSAEVYVDGGVRRGAHGLAALALGAKGVFLGRSPWYALAVAGSDGVTRLLDEVTDELAEAMRLAGCNRLAAVGRDLLVGR